MRRLAIGAWILTAVAAGLPAAASAGGRTTDEQVGVALRLTAPGVGDFDAYRVGTGAEVQYRRWYGFGGFALSVGAERWASARRSGNWNGELDGHTTLFPVGASALGRWPLSEGLLLRGEAGLRLVPAASRLERRIAPDAPWESIRLRPGVIFVGAVGADQLLTEALIVYADVFYQHDIVKGRARTDAGRIMDHHLLGFGARLGIQYWF